MLGLIRHTIPCRYHVLEDGVGGYLLEILSAEWADEGEWKCVATSAGGRVGISTCYVAMDGRFSQVDSYRMISSPFRLSERN